MTKTLIKSKISKDKQSIELTASGDLSIKYAAQIKINFLQCTEEKRDLHLMLEHITLIDIPAIQLIYGLKKSIEKGNGKFTLSLPANADLRTLIEKTGINKIV